MFVLGANSQENPQNKELKISFFKYVPGGPLSGALGHGTLSRCGRKVLSCVAVQVLLRLKTELWAGLLGPERTPLDSVAHVYKRETTFHTIHTRTCSRQNRPLTETVKLLKYAFSNKLLQAKYISSSSARIFKAAPQFNGHQAANDEP